MPIPKSLSKKKQTLLIGKPCIKKNGDIDNLCKIVLDASNGVLFRDDCQVYHLLTQKVYSDNPRIEIRLIEYEG